MNQEELKQKEKEYKRQQTEYGQKSQRVLENMVRKLRQQTGVSMTAGTLKPVRNINTGEITNYFEER